MPWKRSDNEVERVSPGQPRAAEKKDAKSQRKTHPEVFNRGNTK